MLACSCCGTRADLADCAPSDDGATCPGCGEAGMMVPAEDLGTSPEDEAFELTER